MLNLICMTINDFCLDFIKNPYMSYTEHGQHALIYTMLYNSIPEEKRFVTWMGQKICVLQKEYPTAGKLDKPQRQHWDVAILKSPPESHLKGPGSFDYHRLLAAIEFGLNESKEHLKDDIDRLCHQECNVENRFIIHLYRLSKGGAKFSGRDWSPKSPRILSIDDVRQLTIGKPVQIFYVLSDSTGKHKSGIWSLKNE